jgi:membrane-associated phospholipid phosphatase
VNNASSQRKPNKAPPKRRRDWASRRWHAAREWIASERLRRVRTYIFQGYVLIALIAFAGLALLANTVPVFQPDVYITRDLQSFSPPWFSLFMQWISWSGYGIQSSLIVAGVTAVLVVIGLHWEALLALVVGVSAGALNTLVKVAVHRPRPGEDLVNVFQELNSYSFPSGHVMFYTAYYGFLLFLSFTMLKRRLPRYLINTVLIILIALVGISRMYLGEHWASDVLGGYLLGSLLLIVTVMVYRWGKTRFFAGQPFAPQLDHAPVPHEEKNEIKEAFKNPVMMQKEQARQEIKEDVKDNANDHHSDHSET